MAITTPVYSTRESMKRALDINETARNNRNLDRALQSASRRVDGLCHRTFYPEVATKYFDWPNDQGALPWRIWLDDTDLISVTSVSSGGSAFSASDYILEPNRQGPPYTRLELVTSSSASFGGSASHQRDVAVTGLWGHSNVEISSGTVIEALDSSETAVDVDAETASDAGVGAIIRVDDERMIVVNKTLLDTGVDVGGAGLTAHNNNVAITVSDGTQFSVEEIITVDGERMLIVDIAGNSLIVVRGYDGTVLAAHAAGAGIYAQRTLHVMRGALGTVAATHTLGSSVQVWDPPPAIEQLATAEAIHELMQEQTGWFRTMSASSNFGGTAKRAATIEALLDLRVQVYRAYGRKARTRTI